MKSFLVKNKRPICKWTLVPDGIMFKYKAPEGYDIAITPGLGNIVIDVDRHGDLNGFDEIPKRLADELDQTLNYKTRNNGKHFWFRYTGNKTLACKPSGIGVDLRIDNRGYVVWYNDKPIEDCLHKMKDTSEDMNKWIESLFEAKTKIKR